MPAGPCLKTIWVGFALLTAAFGMSAHAQQAPLGVFLDHRGEGGVELAPCGDKLCGHVVWLRDGTPAKGCGLEIIGDAAPVKEGVWDGGWILDPQIGERFDVEITRLNAEEVQIIGYLGTKDLSETYVWKKAPDNLIRCSQQTDIVLISAQ